MPGRTHRAGQDHLGSHTSPVGFGFGVLIAPSLLVIPGATIACIGRLPRPTAVANGPPLTYGFVALAIVPVGTLAIPWNGRTASFAVLRGAT
jgi:D-galactosaminyltransferase